MKFYVKCAALAIAAATTACSGSSSSSGVPPALSTARPLAGATRATLTLTIPRSAQSAARMEKAGRKRHYVSYGTLGLAVSVYPTDTNPANAVVTNYDVSPSSNLCPLSTQQPDERDCTIDIPAPVGNDSFIVSAYKNTPAQGFASGTLLSYGTTSTTIVAAQSNTVAVVLAEVVDSVVFLPPRSIPIGNQETNTQLSAIFLDAAGYAQPPSDSTPFAEPIKIAVSEAGTSPGVVHTFFQINQGFGVAFVTIAKPSDTAAITVDYDGQASIGYYATLTATAQGTAVGLGQVDPLFITSASPLYNGTINFTAAGQSVTLALNEADLADSAFPSTFSSSNFTSSPCTTIASVSAPTSGSTPTVTVSALGGAGSCDIDVSIEQLFTPGSGEEEGVTKGFIIPVSSSI